MESQAVKRRVNTLAAHFTASLNQDISAAAAPTHLQLLPQKCSSSLNSIMRYDNRMQFARQASDSQACFMRKASTEQKCSSILKSDVRRCDNMMYFARQGSDSQGCFMRQTSTKQSKLPLLGVPSKYTSCSYNSSSNALSVPLFSRISRMESNMLAVGTVQHTIGDFKSLVPGPDSPKFARAARETNEPKQPAPGHPKFARPDAGELKWSPRMDVAESDGKYIIAVKLPDITINKVGVVVDDQKLTVMGNRSTQWWKMAVPPCDSISLHHKHKIIQGAYQIVWPLPSNANRYAVSAEFADGILQINIPKV